MEEERDTAAVVLAAIYARIDLLLTRIKPDSYVDITMGLTQAIRNLSRAARDLEDIQALHASRESEAPFNE